MKPVRPVFAVTVKTYKESRSLPHSYDQLFELVADVESYPEFVPWVQALHVVDRGHQRMRARMTVSFLGFEETLDSRIFFDPKKQWIRIDDRGESTKQLHSQWRFSVLASGWTRTHFLASFEMRSMILQLVAGQFFSMSSSQIVSAFQARAKEKLPILPEPS